MIMNKMHENQHLLYIIPLIRENNCFCISVIFPVDSGCFICVNFLQNVVKTLGLSVAFNFYFSLLFYLTVLLFLDLLCNV